jgi:lipopolysaccharide/colanic/teichoic acid biosynthesis glycosyltransferase
VRLPAYFQALNRSFRYQLTIVGTRGWRARVVKEIANNRFTIQSDVPGTNVSWQVTGVRHDPYANAHRISVVLEKSAKEQGKYLHPELYGKSRALSVVPKIAAQESR